MSTHPLEIATLALLLAAGGSTPAAAQDRITLRYRPETRGQVNMRSWTEIESKIAMGGMIEMVAAIAERLAQAFGDTGQVSQGDTVAAVLEEMGEDSVVVQLQLAQTVTERLIQIEPRGVRMRRVVVTDSARVRAADGAWDDQDRYQFPATSADLVLDRRMRILEFDPAARDSSRGGLLQGILRGPSGFEVVLPEEPVAVGTSWTADMLLPFGSTADLAGGGAPAGPEIMTHARFTLDSLVVRPADTLAYLSVVGMLEPAATTESEEGMVGTATVTGNFGGYLIWSTAWSAFVSGSSRFRMVLEMQVEPEEEGAGAAYGFGMRMDLRNRFQVQP